jgi:hypothetical protein
MDTIRNKVTLSHLYKKNCYAKNQIIVHIDAEGSFFTTLQYEP